MMQAFTIMAVVSIIAAHIINIMEYSIYLAIEPTT